MKEVPVPIAESGRILATLIRLLGSFDLAEDAMQDPYLPTLGNGGYDVQHYDLTLDCDPVTNTMVSKADLTIRATQVLSEFSLDLCGFPGATATIDGIPAGVAPGRQADHHTDIRDRRGARLPRRHRLLRHPVEDPRP
jgi:hypothetical protein